MGPTADRSGWLTALVSLVTVALYLPLLAMGWTWWDDPGTIHHNPLLNPPAWAHVGHYWIAIGADAPSGLYIPLTYTFWSGLAALAHLPQPDRDGISLDPLVFHAANVALHAAAAALVFRLLRQLLLRDWAAAFGAMLFAVHPIQVEAVAWISGGKDVLCGMLSVAALWQYVLAVDGREMGPHRSLRSRRIHWILATFLLAGAMLSKPTAIVVPLMAAVIDWGILHRSTRQLLRSLWFWFVLIVPFVIIADLSQPAPWSSPLPIWIRPGIAADALAFYLWKLLWPMQLCPDYGHRPPWVAAHAWWHFTWLVPLLAAIVLWRLRRKTASAPIAGLLFVLPLIPVLGLVPFDFQFFSVTADHYLYLAMLGPSLLLAGMFMRFPGQPFRIVATAGLAVLALRTLLQEPMWQNDQTLFQHTLAVNGDSFAACDLLGFDHSRAAGVLASEAQRAARAGNPQAMMLATQLATQGRAELLAAVDDYTRGLAIYPTYVPSLFNLAIVYRNLGQMDRAREMIDRVRDAQPSLPPGLRADPIGLARAMIDLGDPAGARQWLDEMLRHDPTNLQAIELRRIADARWRSSTTRPTDASRR